MGIALLYVVIDACLCRSMLATGLPLVVQSSLYSISNIIVQSTVNSFGADAVTGWGSPPVWTGSSGWSPRRSASP